MAYSRPSRPQGQLIKVQLLKALRQGLYHNNHRISITHSHRPQSVRSHPTLRPSITPSIIQVLISLHATKGSKSSISMALPASMSSTSVFQILPPRPYPAQYPTNHLAKNGPHGAQIKNTPSGVPKSPQRFMMLPPQTAPSMSSAAAARHSGSQSKTSSASTGTKRRTSSNAKVDQETREKLRKVSHSAIERRRRERINDKILQLKHLVPACVDEDHLHKLSILQSTIEYIQYLKSVIPESVANATLKKATNDNPNNKTTDMLDAFTSGPSSSSSSSSSSTFTPMMTTGLGHPYSKRARTDAVSHTSKHDSTADATLNLRHKRPSVRQSSADEDAKEGLLLLSQLSSGHHSASASPSLAPERTASDSRGNKRIGKAADRNEYEDDEGALQDDSEVSDDLEGEDDEDYREEVLEKECESDKSGEGTPRRSSKMSVMEMLC
ncbi:hypothetical protein BGX28_008006 [Mortierella sp. GBA30]|nr:hypothetical protein BGX28_008006 [Mortierella sp. GBA30]